MLGGGRHQHREIRDRGILRRIRRERPEGRRRVAATCGRRAARHLGMGWAWAIHPLATGWWGEPAVGATWLEAGRGDLTTSSSMCACVRRSFPPGSTMHSGRQTRPLSEAMLIERCVGWSWTETNSPTWPARRSASLASTSAATPSATGAAEEHRGAAQQPSMERRAELLALPNVFQSIQKWSCSTSVPPHACLTCTHHTSATTLMCNSSSQWHHYCRRRQRRFGPRLSSQRRRQ